MSRFKLNQTDMCPKCLTNQPSNGGPSLQYMQGIAGEFMRVSCVVCGYTEDQDIPTPEAA